MKLHQDCVLGSIDLYSRCCIACYYRMYLLIFNSSLIYRLLNKNLLSEVFSFLDLSIIQEVCRYWSIISKEISSISIIKLDKTQKVHMKKSKSDIKTELAQIYTLKKLREQDYLKKLEVQTSTVGNNALAVTTTPDKKSSSNSNHPSENASPTKEKEETLNTIINAYHDNNTNVLHDKDNNNTANSDSDISIDDEDAKYCDLFSSNTLLNKHFKANKHKSKPSKTNTAGIVNDNIKPSNIHISYDTMLHKNNINTNQDLFTTKVTPSLPSPPMKSKQPSILTPTTIEQQQLQLGTLSSHNTQAINYSANAKHLPIHVYDSNTQQQQLLINKSSSKHKSKEIHMKDVDLPVIAESKRKLRVQHTTSSNTFTRPKV